MAGKVTEGAVALCLAGGSNDQPVVGQVLDFRPMDATKYRVTFSDGKESVSAILHSSLTPAIKDGQLQNFGLLRVLECHGSKHGSNSVLIITEAEIVESSVGYRIGGAPGNLSSPLSSPLSAASGPDGSPRLHPTPPSPMEAEMLTPPSATPPATGVKKETAAVKEGHDIISGAPRAVKAGVGSRRVYPIQTLNPYQGNWTIKARVMHKGQMRTYKNARGDGSVFSIDLMDQEGTQIQCTMFREAADKFFPIFQQGKVYYIAKGSLRAANKAFSAVKNDYEMNLGANAEVELVPEEEGASIGAGNINYKFVGIGDLGTHVGGRELVDVIGVVQSVSSLLQIRRKINNEEIPKRDVTIADQSAKTVVVSLWNNFALEEGARLLDMVDSNAVVCFHGLRVGDFQGVSLSTTGRSSVTIEPGVPEAKKLAEWYSSEGRAANLTAAGAGLAGAAGRGPRSLYEGRATLKHITTSSLGEDKPEYFTTLLCFSLIKPDQPMWYNACPGTNCNKKVVGEAAPFWCEGCSKNYETFRRRFIMSAKVSDPSGEAWVSSFNEQAEQVVGMSADELAVLKENDHKEYESAIKRAQWRQFVARMSLSVNEYNNEKRQRITIRSLHPVDFAAECRHLIQGITKIRTGGN